MNNVKKSISWADLTINPVKGLCPVGCSYCYARRLYQRFKWNPTIRYDKTVFDEIHALKTAQRIFVGSTIDLFHNDTIGFFPRILENVQHSPWHTFIFLTKCPENLAQWSPFPHNVWIGVSVDGTPDNSLGRALYNGLNRIEALVKFLSFEPLLVETGIAPHDLTGKLFEELRHSVDWIIIGQQTPSRKATVPKIEWIKQIVEAADKAGIPVFLKNNLRDVLIPDALMDDIFWANEKAQLRQEFPNNYENI